MIKMMLSEGFGTLCFTVAIVHTFAANWIHRWGARWTGPTSVGVLLRVLGEVELAMGLWALVWLIGYSFQHGLSAGGGVLGGIHFEEPLFVVVVMIVCATRPILRSAEWVILTISRWIPGPPQLAYYVTCLIVGPLLGSVITEPAAMTVTAALLMTHFYKLGLSRKAQYLTLGLLLLNVSVGGALTPYAAPPIVMVASQWGWDFLTMMTLFGWRSILVVVSVTIGVAWVLRRELCLLNWQMPEHGNDIPGWVIVVHLAIVGILVGGAHHVSAIIGVALVFAAVVAMTRQYQSRIQWRQGALIGIFLTGIIILGAEQREWVTAIISGRSPLQLFIGAIGLSAITDNAAVTYIGGLVSNLDAVSQYALVSGALVGGGLTVIANAPNPIAFAVLKPSFEDEEISPVWVTLGALGPTLVAVGVFGWV
ncbi:hypothetical protein EBR57_06230 [bacterium]|nr:hypothetical protein [bacterium]